MDMFQLIISITTMLYEFGNCRLCYVKAERSNRVGCWIFHLDFIWKVQSWSTKGKFGLDAAGMHSPDDFMEKTQFVVFIVITNTTRSRSQLLLFYFNLPVMEGSWKSAFRFCDLVSKRFVLNLKISKFPPTRVSFRWLPILVRIISNPLRLNQVATISTSRWELLLITTTGSRNFFIFVLSLSEREESVDKSLLLDFPKLMQLITFPTRPRHQD